jgi:prepilin-type N-terminal cleavage/methylation domain-containing protein
MGRKSRRGFSLLEVVLAAAILAATAILLSQIAGFARRSLEKLELQTQAQLLCQSKLAEIVAGVEPFQAVSRGEFPEAPGWYYSIESSPAELSGILSVRVSTWFEREDQARGSNVSSASEALVSYTIVRWIRDPNRRQGRSEGTSRGGELGDFYSTSDNLGPRAMRRGSVGGVPLRGRNSRLGFGGFQRAP